MLIKLIYIVVANIGRVSHGFLHNRRKRRRIVFMKQYFESTLLAMAYLSTQRGPRDLGSFISSHFSEVLTVILGEFIKLLDPPSVILATLEAIPEMSKTEKLQAYAK
jgi:hypothetical protein